MTTDGPERLLYLLQVANASFPTGAFNHSYGFETWIDAGALDDGARFERACRDWLRYGVACYRGGCGRPRAPPCGGGGSRCAHRARRDPRRVEAQPGSARSLVQDRPGAARRLPRCLRRRAPRALRRGGARGALRGASGRRLRRGGGGAGDRCGRRGPRLPSRRALQPGQRRRAADPARPDREPADHQGGLAAAGGGCVGRVRHGVGRAGQRHRRPRYRQHAARAPAHAAACMS